MKNFSEYRNIKKSNGFITEQEFITDKGPEKLEVELVGPENEKIPLTPVKEEPKEMEMEGGVTKDSLITKLLTFQTQLKVFHWNTMDYAQHKGSDKTYKEFSDVLDSFVETYQGYYSRVKFVDAINIRNLEDLNVNEWLASAEEDIHSLRAMVSQTDLQNLLDEMSGTVGKFMYFLTLK